MTTPRARRPATDALFAPDSIAVIGSEHPAGARILANLRRAGFTGEITAIAEAERFTVEADLAVIACPAAEVEAALDAVAATACRAAIVTSQVANLGEMARARHIRVLGPSSFGLAVPRLRIDASLSHMPVPPGHVALATQSASLARAVIDWAGPNGVGFSQVTGIGGNVDTGFGAVLDWLSRDTETRLILLDIRRVRARRTFISAARAASRLRPVVALRPGGRLLDATGRADLVFEAALNRAGVFTVQTLQAFLAAAETLSRARPLRGEAMAIVTNAIGPGRLAADAALRAGIKLAILPPEAQATLTRSLPADLIYGLVYAGSAAPTDVASIAAMISAVPEVGGVLVLLAPTGQGDEAAVQAVIAAGHTAKLPVLTCIMGETTGAAARQLLAEAGLPAFATPEEAVEGFGHLLRARRARQSARELPGRSVLEMEPDRATVDRILSGSPGKITEHPDPALAGLVLDGLVLDGLVLDGLVLDGLVLDGLVLDGERSMALLAAYGVCPNGETAGGSEPGRADCSIEVHDDETFGPAIGLVSQAGRQAYDLPPLNLKLARDLATRAGLDTVQIELAADALVRISQLLVDQPRIASMRIGRLHLWGAVATVTGAAIALFPSGRQGQLAISPYPEHLVHRWSGAGQDFVIRPIRPEDAAAHADMVARLPPDDLRYRFFSAMRQVAPEQMARLTQIDYDREIAFIAVRTADQATVGVGRLVCEREGEPGEFAILVQPDTKGLGLARHLMECLIAWARGHGLARITGQVLVDNHRMLGFVRQMGFTLSALPGESDVLEASFDLLAGAETLSSE